MGFDRSSGARRCSWLGLAIFGWMSLGASGAEGQSPAAARPQFKGIWEPVSFSEDLDLKDVFFVTADVGWAAGAGGTIIYTKDAGKTWTAQLGGDPASTEEEITDLRFIDEYRGWARQGKHLLRTVNGQEWEQVQGVLPNWAGDYAFVSPRRGVVAGTLSSVGSATEMFLTVDGGKTWKPVAQCGIKVAIDGLNKNVSCIIDRIQFPTPQVGYLVGYSQCVGMGCGGPPVIGKTEDGGATWRFMLGPGDVKTTRLRDVFFIDERRGFLNVQSSGSEAKIYVTADGGETWKGVVGSPGQWLRFADPEVGWGFDEDKLNFTSDGGARWGSRPHRFPAHPRAVSFPRRDRAYVAGDNGMVFRYRVVPFAQTTPPEVLVTAAMPGFGSPLGEQVAELDLMVDSLQTFVQQLPPQPASNGTAATSDSSAAAVGPVPTADAPLDPTAPFDASLPAPSAFTNNCCAKKFSRLEVLLTAIAGSLPQLITKNKNTNLLLAAVRMLADLPGQFRSVRSGLALFRTAQDQGTAAAALAQVTGAIEAFKTQTSAALQKDLPPLDFGPPAPPSDQPGNAQANAGTSPPVSAPLVAPQAAADSGADSTTAKKEGKVAESAKASVGKLLKKKIRIP